MHEPRSESRLLPRWLPRSSIASVSTGLDNRPEEDEVDIGALLSTIWRGKWLVVLWTIIAILIAGAYVFVIATPVFRATTSVVLETRESQVVNFDSVIGESRTDPSAVNTEVEILKGRLLMGRVVDALDLAKDPEFNGTLRIAGWTEGILAFVTARINSLVSPRPEEVVGLTTEALRERIISALIRKVAVTNTPLSLVFTISVESEDAVKSAQIADMIGQLYIEDQVAMKFEATQQATAWLAQRVSELQSELEAAEENVKDFRANSDVVDIATLEQADQQMATLRARLSEQVVLRDAGVARVAALDAAGTLQEKQLVAADASLSRLIALRESAVDLALVDAEIASRIEAVKSEATLDVQRAEAQIVSLTQSRDALQATIGRQSDALSAFQQLAREADSVRLIYEYFLNRLQETSVQQGLQQADSRILSPAVIPERPASPQKSRILAISVVLGMMAGVVFVFLRDSWSKGFRTGRDLEQLIGYPVMGQVPIIRARGHRAMLSYLASKPASSAAESVRNLRTSMLLSNMDNSPKVIMTTSALPSEGKTTIALALAQNLVGLKRNVLLIEGDLRRRTVSRIAIESAPRHAIPEPMAGLQSVLTGALTLQEAIVKDDLLGADVLIGELSDTSAADVFSSDGFARLLGALREMYDIIIIDTPPVLLVPDARVIAQHVDAILFVVRWNQTTVAQVRAGLRMIESVNCKVSGMVLTQINSRQVHKYGDSDTYGALSRDAAAYYQN